MIVGNMPNSYTQSRHPKQPIAYLIALSGLGNITIHENAQGPLNWGTQQFRTQHGIEKDKNTDPTITTNKPTNRAGPNMPNQSRLWKCLSANISTNKDLATTGPVSRPGYRAAKVMTQNHNKETTAGRDSDALWYKQEYLGSCQLKRQVRNNVQI